MQESPVPGSNDLYVAGIPTQDHPYYKASRPEFGVEVLSDEDYPRKRADAFLCAASPEMQDALDKIITLVQSRRPKRGHELRQVFDDIKSLAIQPLRKSIEVT